ncbi:MAG: Endoribonuclease, partial [Adhaeribacter sp.]|nr:Endoribonuclease [Adhaeribacter sp.]
MKILLSVLLLISFLGFSDLTWLAPVVGSRLIPRQVIVTKNHLQKTKPVIKEIMPSVATGSSRAVVVEEVPLAHTTQLMPLNPQGELVGRGDISKQVNQVLANISQVLKEADSKIENLVKLNIYLAHPGLEPTVQAQLAQRFKATFKPAVSYVVSDLNAPGALVAMDAIATAVLPANNQGVKYFRSKALGKNSDPVQVALLPAGGVVYVSGQADKGALPEATRGTLQQLKATLAHLDLQLEDVVQLKCFIYPVTGVALVEKEIEQFFKGKTIPPVI